jgi:hypothetical protein
MPGALGREAMTERLKDGAVEAPARLEVGDAQMDVIDQAALVELHTDLPWRSSRGCAAQPRIA